MNSEEKYYFEALKKEVEATFLENTSATNAIENWKGEEIVRFQEDLFSKVKGKVSEKWFYTYIKNSPEKLPRIDVLNLLSDYSGFTNWSMFKAKKSYSKPNKKAPSKIVKYSLLLILPILGILYFSNQKNTFTFCFIDTLKNENITSIPLDIKVLQSNESPLYFKTDSLGCFTYKTKKEVIKFVIQSPFHKTDTIVRSIRSSKNQIVKVEPDDYALMLNYYVNGNVKDWKIHTEKLKSIISDNAKIYRMFNNNNINIEIYSKEEFIRMITIPTKSLKRTEILEKETKNGKITALKFIVR